MSKRYTLEELKEKVDMEQLKQFNPKLYSQLEKDPDLLLDLQDTLIEHEQHAEAAATAEALTAVAEQAAQPRA